MDWNRGFSSTYIVNIVDPNTWADMEQFEIISGKITSDVSSGLMQSASYVTDKPKGTGEHYIRIYLLAKQGGAASKTALFTGLTASPERKLNGLRNEYSVNAYSVLKPAQDIIVRRGFYIPRLSGANKAAELLEVCKAPVVIEDDSPLIATDIVAGDGDTNLDMAIKLINAIGWRMKIQGDGTIVICPKANNKKITFGVNENDCIETSVSDKYDWYDCPNVFMAISDENGVSVARDDSESSPMSTVNRGREVWMCENNITLPSNENIVEYTKRRLAEEQNPTRTVSYTRRFVPDLDVSDVIELNYPAHDLVGRFVIASQSLSLGYGCPVSEEVERIEWI